VSRTKCDLHKPEMSTNNGPLLAQPDIKMPSLLQRVQRIMMGTPAPTTPVNVDHGNQETEGTPVSRRVLPSDVQDNCRENMESDNHHSTRSPDRISDDQNYQRGGVGFEDRRLTRSPDRRERSPDRSERSPDCRERSPDRRQRSPDRRQRSPDVDLSEYIVECTEDYAGLHQDDEEDQCWAIVPASSS
jgi:hypothetical protein